MLVLVVERSVRARPGARGLGLVLVLDIILVILRDLAGGLQNILEPEHHAGRQRRLEIARLHHLAHGRDFLPLGGFLGGLRIGRREHDDRRGLVSVLLHETRRERLLRTGERLFDEQAVRPVLRGRTGLLHRVEERTLADQLGVVAQLETITGALRRAIAAVGVDGDGLPHLDPPRERSREHRQDLIPQRLLLRALPHLRDHVPGRAEDLGILHHATRERAQRLVDVKRLDLIIRVLVGRLVGQPLVHAVFRGLRDRQIRFTHPRYLTFDVVISEAFLLH